MELTWQRIFLRRSRSCLYRPKQFFSGSCNSSRHQSFMREKIFKTKISENISQKFHDQWKIW